MPTAASTQARAKPGRKIMRRRVKARRTRAIVKHVHRGSVVDSTVGPIKTETKADETPTSLDQTVRKPLNTAQASRNRKSRRRNKHQRRKLLDSLANRLQASNHWHGKLIRPHAVLEWLERSEPYKADYLLEHSEDLSYEDGADFSDPVFGSELDAIITKFTASAIAKDYQTQDNIPVPKDFGMMLTPLLATGHANHDAMMTYEDEKQNFMTRLMSGRRPSKAVSETDDEDEEMLDALTKQMKSSGQSALETVIEEESDMEESKEGQSQTPRGNDHGRETIRGFDAVQVLKKHAIGLDDLSVPAVNNLDCAIHPIFRLDNFHDCPQYIYDILKPGLRLCTLFMTHRATSSFWHTLTFGDRISTANPLIKRIIKDVPWSAQRADEYAAKLQSFADSLHFHFGLFPTPKHTMQYSYASMHPIKDHLVGWQAKPGEPCRRSRIRIHTDFYTTARKLSKLRTRDEAQVLRFNFFFAVNLAHELAHFLWMSSWSTKRVDVYSSGAEVLGVEWDLEPYFNEQEFSELGAAFEVKVFGGRVEPICCRSDCAYGLTTSDQPNDTHPHTTRTFYTIPMDYIAKMQQQSTWDQDHSGSDWKVFHIPRNGAKSVSVPYFDMTVWKDEATDRISDVGLRTATPFKRVPTGIVRAEELESKA